MLSSRVGVLGIMALLGVGALAQAPAPDQVEKGSAMTFPDSFFVQDLDTDLGESFEDNSFAKEKAYITQVATTFVGFSKGVQKSSGAATAMRGAHAKSLACLKTRVEIENAFLPEPLRVGLFSQNGKVYKGWVRISNSSQDPKSADSAQNTRGFAIKLLGVDGHKFLNPEKKPSDSGSLDGRGRGLFSQ